MKNSRIFVILALFLVTHAHCRPNDQTETDTDVNDSFQDDDPNGNDDYGEQEDNRGLSGPSEHRNYANDSRQDDHSHGDDDDSERKNNRGPPSSPPEIKSRPLHLEVKPGSKVELPCIVVNAEDLVVAWRKGNRSLYLGSIKLHEEPNRIVLSNDTSTLIIYDVTEADSSDQWSCEIETEPVTRIIHSLHVVNNPDKLWEGKIIRPFPSKIIHVNESGRVDFGCETKPGIEPIIKWSHQGKRLHNGEAVDGNYVTIKQANRHHYGHYQCLVENGSSDPPSESIQVVVNYAPVIEVKREIVHGGIGMESKLECQIYAHPRAKVTWLQNGMPITNKKDKKLTTDDKSRAVLLIERTSKHDLGNYTCTATNSMGEAFKDIELTGKPEEPKFVQGQLENDDSTMTLKWKLKSFSPITQYLMEYRLKGTTEWMKVSPKVNDAENNEFSVEYSLKNLSSGSYEATVMAQNSFGWSPRSPIHNFRKEYASDEPRKTKDDNSSASVTRPFVVSATILLVVASYVSTSF